MGSTSQGCSSQNGSKFASTKIEKLIKDILEAYLYHTKYNADKCSKLAQDLCVMIKDKTKDLGLDRYRLIVQVLIGQDSDISVELASRCLWNQETDNFAAATYRNASVYAIGIVYGLRLDGSVGKPKT